MSGQAVRQGAIGSTIGGRYVVEALLGGGGMGAVYRVRDQRCGRVLALKRGARKSSSNKRKDLLEREFHTLAQLAHPCIIEVYDYGVDEDGPYYTMELLDGADLHNGGPLPWREVCSLLRDVASSLALLHSRGLIHRDVSARNVRKTSSGRAKLMDFGAMTPMGVAKDVVGTPPFLAPEVLQMQSLDARADLFSVGALGYYLLTGTHAFPARRFRDLRDAWRSRPAPATKLQPEVPQALNALIMQLLALDRGARAHSAAEVMQRLCTLAGLPAQEDVRVPRAYLSTPTLIGRDQALLSVRRRMLSLGRGDGGTLLIEGAPGAGRSRMLDACALEAKLMGAAVIRADASDQHGDWAAVRTLGQQLLQIMPDQAHAAAKLSRDVLAQVIDGLRGDGSYSVSAVVNDRSLLIRELRDFVLSLARAQRLVIVIDDIERMDETSAAVLAAIAHKTERHPLILAIALDADRASDPSPSVRLLQLVGERIAIGALAPEQTETLLRSVFGDPPRLPLVAARIHALSQGNPRAILALAQHLVDTGLAQYDSGAWSLPTELGDHDLPESLSASLSACVHKLSPDARELCEILCLSDADEEPLSLSALVELSSHRDPHRVRAALDEAGVARVLVAEPERHRFAQRGFVPVIDALIAPTQRARLHQQLADRIGRIGGDVVERATHLLLGDCEPQAVELLATLDLRQRHLPLALLERMVAAAERHGFGARQIHDLRRALVQRASLDIAVDTFREHAPILLAELARDSGLTRYRELTDLPENDRIVRAISEAHQRYQALPEHERVNAVADAVRNLAWLCGTHRGIALAAFDGSLLESVPSLAPFAPLSPAIALVETTGQANADSLRGRFERSRAQYQVLLDKVSARGPSGLAPVEVTRAACGAHYVLGLIEAGRGVGSAELHAQALEHERAYQVNAWRVRMLLHLTRGDTEEAARCRRRAELALLREGGTQQYAGTTALGELLCHVLCGDLTGVTHTNEMVARLAARLPGWQPFLVYGQCSSLRLQGDAARALELLLPALERVKAGQHAAFAYLAATHVQLLCDVDRVREAVTHGLAYVEACERQQLTPTAYVVHVATGLALAKDGQIQAACALVDGVIAEAVAHKQGGVCIGSMYEARARIAALAQEREQFDRYADLCAQAYQQGKNANLAVKLARLFEEARQGAISSVTSSIPLRTSLSEAGADNDYVTLHSRMLECHDEGERARCALTMLLQSIDSFAGYLYGVNEEDHVLLAALPEDESIDPRLADWVEDLLADELEPHADSTRRQRGPRADDAEVTRQGRPSGERPSVSFRFTDENGRLFEPLFLTRQDGPDQRLAAVLIYHAARESRRRGSSDLQEEIADQLLAHGDVTGALLGSTATQTHTQ